ncbi:MAG: hypothetical protein LBU85_08890 [Treponema sp.]|nr:hypothetical protein [Treponema sp.]
MVVKIEQSGEFPDMRVYFDAFPELSARLLGYIGKQAAQQLYTEHLKGQDIEFHPNRHGSTGTPYGDKGRRMVTYSIGRGLKWVAVSSFPLNLYENRKQLRRGDAARRGIIRRKLSSGLSGRLDTFIAQAESLIVDDWYMDRKKKTGDKYGMGAIRNPS